MIKIFLKIFLVFIFLLVGCSGSDEQKMKNAVQYLQDARNALKTDNFLDAIDSYNKAIDAFKTLKSDSATGECYLMLADCQCYIGDFSDAMGNYQKAVELLKQFGKKKINRKADLSLAKFYLNLNQNLEAATIAENISVTAKVLSDMEDVYAALSIAVIANHNLGKYDQELHQLDEMMQIEGLLYKNHDVTKLLKQKLTAYFCSGRIDMARSTLDFWLTHANSSGDDENVIRAYETWGILQRSVMHSDSAFRAFSFALSKMDPQLDKNLQINILGSLSELAYRQTHYDDARRYANDAISLVKETDNVIFEQLLNLLIVACDWKIGNNKDYSLIENLITRCSNIGTLCRQLNYLQGEAISLFMNARISEQNDTSNNSISIYKRALQIYEQTPDVGDNEGLEHQIINTLLNAEQSDWFNPLLSYYCAEGNISDAFKLSEERKMYDIQKFYSKVLFKTQDENLNRALRNIQLNNCTQQFIEKEINKEISKGRKASFERIRLLKEQISKLQSDYQLSIDELGKQHQNYKSLLSSQAPDIKAVQNVLESNQVLFDYVVLPANIYSLAVTNDTAYIRRSYIDRFQLQTLISEYTRLISDAKTIGINKRIDELSSVLGEMILKSVAFTIRENSKVYVSPPKEFGWLPIHTLEMKGASLGERADVSYLPSADVLLFSTKKESTVKYVAGIGHAGFTDWDVGYELKDIRSFYDSAKIFLNESATLKSLESIPFDVLQITAEFHVDKEIPNNSGIVLSDGKADGGVNEISIGHLFGIPATQVLVMSSISLTYGGMMQYAPLVFLSNGTPTLIATMWQGDRKIKRYFGEIFYTSLHGGVMPTEVYRNTMIALQKKPEYRESNRWGMYYRFGK